MNKPNCVVRFTKERDPEHGNYIFAWVKMLDGTEHALEAALTTEDKTALLAQLILGNAGNSSVLLKGSFQPQVDPTRYRTVETGEVTYEYRAGEMGFTCKCGESHAIDEYELVCACGRIYRVRHYLEVKEND